MTRSPNASSPPAAACRSSCSPPPTGSTTRPPGSSSAPTTTSRSRSSSESSCSVSERSTAGAPTTGRPCERSQVSGWIRSAERSTATDRYVALTRKQFAVLEVLVAAEGGVVSAEATPGASVGRERRPVHQRRAHHRLGDCANASANPGSSPPCPASATASTRNQTPSRGRRA